MAKGMNNFGKAPSAKVKVGAGVPGDSSRARINEAAGQKATNTPGGIDQPQMLTPGPVAVASGDNMVMPVDHPSSTTTRKVTKGGAL